MLTKSFVLSSLISFLLFSGVVFADQGRRKHFLSQGPGAKAGALNQAFTALANDPTALYYNPAGLSFQRGAFHAEHTPVIEGGRYNFMAFHYPSRLGSFGFGVLQFATDDIKGRRSIGDAPFDVEAQQTAWYLPYSTRWKDLAVGVSLKKIDQNLAGKKDSGTGLDGGLLYSRYINDFYSLVSPNIRIGFSSKNLIRPATVLQSSKERLPTENRLGLAFSANIFGQYRKGRNEMVYDKLTISLDIPERVGRNHPLSLGLEYLLRDLIPLRAGYSDGLTFGLGYGSYQSPFNIDYSLVMTPLEPQHRFSFSYFFTDPKPHPNLSPELRRYKSIQKDAKRFRDRFLKEGHAYLEKRNYEKALQVFEKAMVLYPQNRKIRNLVAQSKEALHQKKTHEKKGLWKMDEKTIVFSQNLRATDIRKLHDDFDKAVLKGDIKKARLFVEQAQTLHPRHPVTLHLISRLPVKEKEIFNGYMDEANVALSNNEWETAYLYFLKAQKISPNNKDLITQMKGFEAHYKRRSRFKTYDILYQDQLYKAAALYCVQGEAGACIRQLKNLLRKNIIHENGNFLRHYLIEKNINPGEINYEQVCSDCPYGPSHPHP